MGIQFEDQFYSKFDERYRLKVMISLCRQHTFPLIPFSSGRLKLVQFLSEMVQRYAKNRRFLRTRLLKSTRFTSRLNEMLKMTIFCVDSTLSLPRTGFLRRTMRHRWSSIVYR